jgi:hypothetical protein
MAVVAVNVGVNGEKNTFRLNGAAAAAAAAFGCATTDAIH